MYTRTRSLEDPRDETSQLHPRGTQRAKGGEREKDWVTLAWSSGYKQSRAHYFATPVHLTIVLYLLPSLLFHSPFSTRTFSDIRVVVNRRSSCTKRAYTLFVIPLTVSRFLSFFLSRVENRAAVSSELSLSLSLSVSVSVSVSTLLRL